LTMLTHEQYMDQALKQAQKAFDQEEVPVGAVVVNAFGKVIARAFNAVEQQHTQLAHAEMQAVNKACKKLGDWRLEGCWVYVTLEPCAMCLNYLILSRVAGIVFGSESPVFGYHLDKEGVIQLYRKNAVAIIGGVRAPEAQALLKSFFIGRRKVHGTRN
jgi:tRNA(adenine34) deaminase